MIDIQYITSDKSGTDAGSYSFTGKSFGAVASNRRIKVNILARLSGSQTLNSVTIGGVSATISVQASNTAGGNTSLAAIAVADVPTGLTGDVDISFSGTAFRCAIEIYRVTGTASLTPTHTGFSTANDPTFNINVDAGGIAIGCAYNADTATASWTGLTEDVDDDVEGAGSRHSGAHALFPTTQTGTTLTCDWSFPLNAVGVFASWAPALGAGETGLNRSPIRGVSRGVMRP